eukprot:SAG11_NODE_18045_length_501_cov_1.276119_1_plen_34_part_01
MAYFRRLNIAYRNNDFYRAAEVGSSMGTVPLAIP